MSSNFTVVFNEYMPLKELVFTTLRKAILKGELQPGERLMEIQLADKMGVSRTPIREAIRKLEKEGLVTMIPRRGAEVAGISEKMLRDVLQVRKTLEELAYTLAYDNIEEEEIERLKMAETAFEKSVRGGELVSMATADEDFHFIIYEAANNDKLKEVLTNLKENMYRYRMEYLKNKSYRDSLIDEHRDIIRSFAEKDKAIGVLTVQRHILNQETAVMDKLTKEAVEHSKKKKR